MVEPCCWMIKTVFDVGLCFLNTFYSTMLLSHILPSTLKLSPAVVRTRRLRRAQLQRSARQVRPLAAAAPGAWVLTLRRDLPDPDPHLPA